VRRDATPVLLAGDIFRPLVRVTFDKAGGGYDEAWLQRLIDGCPACLPVAEIEPGFGVPVAVCREMPTPHGPVDNLLMTAGGDIVLVETKLWRNPQARREVVAQALDYASCLFAMDYEAFEAACLRGSFGGRPRPSRLFDLFAGEAGDEADFVDAVAANLRRGRVMVLVAGDGIRAEAAQLAGVLQSHAGFRFTFALVELAVWQAPDGAHLVVPRTLAQTVMVERGVVQVHEGQVTVLPPAVAAGGGAPRVGSITGDRFLEAMAALDPALPARIRALVAAMEAEGIRPEWRGSLNFVWDRPSDVPVNLGYIKPDGQLWTDVVGSTAPDDLALPYNAELAAALGVELDTTSFKNGRPHIRSGGKAVRVTALGDRLLDWVPVAARFVALLRERPETGA